jgi:hypothetical protein
MLTAREYGRFPIALFTPCTQPGLLSGFGRRAVEKSVYQRGGIVILSGEKPRPASYSIDKPAAVSRVPAIYGASKRERAGRGSILRRISGLVNKRNLSVILKNPKQPQPGCPALSAPLGRSVYEEEAGSPPPGGSPCRDASKENLAEKSVRQKSKF